MSVMLCAQADTLREFLLWGKGDRWFLWFRLWTWMAIGSSKLRNAWRAWCVRGDEVAILYTRKKRFGLVFWNIFVERDSQAKPYRVYTFYGVILGMIALGACCRRNIRFDALMSVNGMLNDGGMVYED